MWKAEIPTEELGCKSRTGRKKSKEMPGDYIVIPAPGLSLCRLPWEKLRKRGSPKARRINHSKFYLLFIYAGFEGFEKEEGNSWKIPVLPLLRKKRSFSMNYF